MNETPKGVSVRSNTRLPQPEQGLRAALTYGCVVVGATGPLVGQCRQIVKQNRAAGSCTVKLPQFERSRGPECGTGGGQLQSYKAWRRGLDLPSLQGGFGHLVSGLPRHDLLTNHYDSPLRGTENGYPSCTRAEKLFACRRARACAGQFYIKGPGFAPCEIPFITFLVDLSITTPSLYLPPFPRWLF